MTLNLIRAQLILNARKGWSDQARRRSARIRAAKAKRGAVGLKRPDPPVASLPSGGLSPDQFRDLMNYLGTRGHGILAEMRGGDIQVVKAAKIPSRNRGSLKAELLRGIKKLKKRKHLLLNSWSDKARRAAQAKRASKGMAKGFANPRLMKRVSEISAARKERMKQAAAAEKRAVSTLPKAKQAKLKGELSTQVKELLEFYRGLRKKLEAKLKVKVPEEIPVRIIKSKSKKTALKKKKVGK